MEIGPGIEKYGFGILMWAKMGSSWTWSWVYYGTLVEEDGCGSNHQGSRFGKCRMSELGQTLGWFYPLGQPLGPIA